MSHRDSNPEPLIIDVVIQRKSRSWNEASQKVARTDALRVLEALIAECGVDAATRALDRQGLEGKSYGYILKPLYEEAVTRRQRAELARAAARG